MPEPSDVTGPRVSRVTCPGDAMRGWRGLGTMKTSWRSSVKLKGWSRNRSVALLTMISILQLKCFHILKIFPPNLLTINPDPADECQSFPLRKLSGLFIANVQAYDTIHRFENLQRQNNSIIHRLSRVEERLAGTQHAGDLLNNRRPAQHKSGEACQLEL